MKIKPLYFERDTRAFCFNMDGYYSDIASYLSLVISGHVVYRGDRKICKRPETI